MDENTDAQSNAATSVNPADEQQLDDNQVENQGTGQQQGEQVNNENNDDANNGGEQKQTRSERRESSFIDKLSEQIRNSSQQANRYNNELFAPKQDYQPVDYRQTVEFDNPELYDKFEQDRKQFGSEQFKQGVQQGATQALEPVKQEMWLDRLEIDNERAARSWDVLDESSEHFNPDIAESMTLKYLNFIGYSQNPQTGQISIERPNIRFNDFVKAEKQNMEMYASLQRENSTKNIVKQAANTGMRPTGQARTTHGKSSFDPNDPAGSLARMSSKEYWEGGGKEESDAYFAQKYK